MTPLEARYHNQCLTALANTNTNAKYEFYKEQAIGGIVMGELIIYIIWERDQTDTDVKSTKIKERLIKMCQTEQLTKGVSHTCRKLERCYWLINPNTPRQCCSHTSWGYSNWKPMMSNSTEFNGSFDKEGVQQAVPMNPFAFTNMIMHRTTIADQRGHGYHWVLLFKLMMKLIALKNAAASSLLSI